jgi:hypothetical protein
MKERLAGQCGSQDAGYEKRPAMKGAKYPGGGELFAALDDPELRLTFVPADGLAVGL